jgi:hypothetical protein
MSFEELPRITKNGESVVDWAAVGLESTTQNPETGDPWKLHRGDIPVTGCVFLWVRDAQKALDAGLGEAIIASLNGTSWKVSQDDVNRAYDKEVAEKGQRGQKVRITLEHRLWNRLTGIRRKPEFRAATVKVVEKIVVKITLPNMALFVPTGNTLEETAEEFRSAWMDAMMQLGIEPQAVVGLAQGQDFAQKLVDAGWKPEVEEK